MKRIALIGLMAVVAILASGIVAADETPDWVTRADNVWVSEGIIYAKGSAKMASPPMSINTSESRARSMLFQALVGNTISGYNPISQTPEKRESFSLNGVSIDLDNLRTIDIYTADDRTVYSLLSCAGAEIKE